MKKCLFIGSKRVGLNSLKKIFHMNSESLLGCVTFDDIDDIRSEFKEIKLFCEQNSINFIVIDKPSNLKNVIKEYKPSFCLVIGWYWIIDDETLKLCEDGIIGVHASLLPKYRGFAPLVWALINGENKTGVSLFYLESGIDCGDVISQKEIQIFEQDYILDLLNNVEKVTENMLEENYNKIVNSNISAYKQVEKEASYCSKRFPYDGLINWNKPCHELYNFIRAQAYPYPGAFIIKDNKKIYIEKSEKFLKMYYGIPGRVVEVNNKKILICCKDGAIYIYPKLKENEIKESFKFGETLINY